MVPFHEVLELGAEGRAGRTPYVLALAKDRTLRRLGITAEIVQLAEERQMFWSQLRQLAGLEIAPVVRDRLAASLAKAAATVA
jgi:pyruvate-ferredoxin/flavodoxin oxidoreductase